LSQTSTYLHAAEMGLQESMARFDAARGKPVAKTTPTEPGLLVTKNREEQNKDLLH
jgi:hypothetical protein